MLTTLKSALVLAHDQLEQAGQMYAQAEALDRDDPCSAVSEFLADATRQFDGLKRSWAYLHQEVRHALFTKNHH